MIIARPCPTSSSLSYVARICKSSVDFQNSKQTELKPDLVVVFKVETRKPDDRFAMIIVDRHSESDQS